VLLIAILLMVEAVWTLPRLAAVVYTIAAYDPLAIALIAARAIVTAMQATAAMLLMQRRPQAPPIARIALAAAAVLLTLEAGFNLAPGPVYSFWRWQVVTIYWLYAGSAVWWLSRGDRRRQ
jgi:hypothetical protein